MKITNERLSDISYNALMGDDSQCAPTRRGEILLITEELQELRAASHWRAQDTSLPEVE